MTFKGPVYLLFSIYLNWGLGHSLLVPEHDLLEHPDQQLVHVVLQPGARLNKLGVVAASQALTL